MAHKSAYSYMNEKETKEMHDKEMKMESSKKEMSNSLGDFHKRMSVVKIPKSLGGQKSELEEKETKEEKAAKEKETKLKEVMHKAYCNKHMTRLEKIEFVIDHLFVTEID